MKAKTTTAIHTLKSVERWIERLDATKQDDEDRAVNTVIGCFYILTDSPTTNLRSWLQRVPRRKALKNASKAVKTKQGRRAIAELITLTISDLEASCSFRPEVEVGPLPVKVPRKLSPEHNAALQQACRKHRQEQQRKTTLAKQREIRVLAN